MLYPNLKGTRRIAIDLETRDPDLRTMGPSIWRGGGHIAGVALAWSPRPEDSIYISINHPDSENQPLENVIRYLNDHVAPSSQVGANLYYDMGWLIEAGYKPAGRWCDVQVAEPLLDEHARSYSLHNLALKYCGETKQYDGLENWILHNLFQGKKPRKKGWFGANIWRAPAREVAEYARSDCWLPLQIFEKQLHQLRLENLLPLFELESDLQPMVCEMRRIGVRVDLQKAEALEAQFERTAKMLQRKLDKLAGFEVNVNAADSLAKLFDKHGWKYPHTSKDNPSFQKDWLQNHDNPVAQNIQHLREILKLKDTFIRSYILEKAVGDRIHCQFNQLRGDDYGTVSGRFSSSLPNLQNIPSRSASGKLIRTLFIPEPGESWLKADYAQIEPRLTLHYAKSSPVVDAIRARYAEDPSTDCYLAMSENMPEGIERFQVKIVYLGMTYTMGLPLLAANLGLTKAEAAPIFEAFHAGAPYLEHLRTTATSRAASRGYIVTLLGRRCRFPFWEKRRNYHGNRDYEAPVRSRELAMTAWGNSVVRAWTYRALNRIIQGSAADVLKKAMVDLYKAGIKIPNLTVHDELDWSIVPDPAVLRDIQRIMESAVETRVPMKVDMELGANWGQVEIWDQK